jgi:two-component system response regulator
LRLPKINGLEVLKQIRSTEKTKNMPVILFVSSCQEMDMLESLRPNDCSYIVKPIDFLNLKEAIWNTQYFILPTFWDAEEKHVLYQMG